jgi:hypothetical protein
MQHCSTRWAVAGGTSAPSAQYACIVKLDFAGHPDWFYTGSQPTALDHVDIVIHTIIEQILRKELYRINSQENLIRSPCTITAAAWAAAFSGTPTYVKAFLANLSIESQKASLHPPLLSCFDRKPSAHFVEITNLRFILQFNIDIFVHHW